MDANGFKNNEGRDEGLAKELLYYTAEKLPRYAWLLAEAVMNEDVNKPHGAG